jgi:hypothetical protein
MHSGISKALLFILLLVFIGLPITRLQAEDGDDSKPAFVDLDGDGFNDNASDADNNSIPDEAESNHDTEVEPENAFLAFKPIESIGDFDLSSLLDNSEKFGKLKALTSAISCCRGGLEPGESFGPGNGIGSGAVAGGCPGGICH